MVKSNIGKKDTHGKSITIISHRRPEPFDWYQVYSGIKDIITQYMTKTDKILNIGCGNSRKSILNSSSRIK